MTMIYTKVKQFEASTGVYLANIIQEWANVNVIEIAAIAYAISGDRHCAIVTYKARKYEEIKVTDNKTPIPNPVSPNY